VTPAARGVLSHGTIVFKMLSRCHSMTQEGLEQHTRTMSVDVIPMRNQRWKMEVNGEHEGFPPAALAGRRELEEQSFALHSGRVSPNAAVASGHRNSPDLRRQIPFHSPLAAGADIYGGSAQGVGDASVPASVPAALAAIDQALAVSGGSGEGSTRVPAALTASDQALAVSGGGGEVSGRGGGGGQNVQVPSTWRIVRASVTT